MLQKPRSRKPADSRNSYERIAPWLQLANLLPPPPLEDQQSQPSVFATRLQINAWEASTRAIQAGDLITRFEKSGLARTAAFRDSIDLVFSPRLPDQAQFLAMVREVASTLDTLCRASAPHVLKAAGEQALRVKRLFITPCLSRTEVWIRQGMICTYQIDPFRDFLAALERTPVGCIRRCPICCRFFFALRKDQKACTKRCNALRRVREWRTKQAQHEYRRKLRSAGLLASRRSIQR